jgi:uncharacterized protein (TIGR03790 family)
MHARSRKPVGVLLLLRALVLPCLAACVSPPPTSKPGTIGPGQVLVVVNTRSEASIAVGNYYVSKRGVSPSHLVRVSVPVDDEIASIQFLADIVKPVRDAIESLPVRIDYIVLTTGMPLRIGGNRGYSVDAHLAGMKLAIPPMVGLDTLWLARYRNPYFGSLERFNSERFGMYLVTRLDCARLADCFALVDRSVAARPTRGPFFFDAAPPKFGDAGYLLMNRSLYTAAFRLRFSGLDVQLDSSARFIAPPAAVMGYASWGSNDDGFDSSAYRAIRFLPGALAETFVSTSARSFGPAQGGQSRIVDLIAQGVTGVKGYVSEPYTIALADPDILFDRYLRGFTLAEAFYAASRMVLWKDVVIGDPLCAPYAMGVEPFGPRLDVRP